MSYLDNNIARIATPIFSNNVFSKIRKLSVAICLTLAFLFCSSAQGKQVIEDFRSSLRGFMEVLTSDVPQAPKPMAPKPPSFSFTKGFGQSGSRP
jgi:hypothetical protein